MKEHRVRTAIALVIALALVTAVAVVGGGVVDSSTPGTATSATSVSSLAIRTNLTDCSEPGITPKDPWVVIRWNLDTVNGVTMNSQGQYFLADGTPIKFTLEYQTGPESNQWTQAPAPAYDFAILDKSEGLAWNAAIRYRVGIKGGSKTGINGTVINGYDRNDDLCISDRSLYWEWTGEGPTGRAWKKRP